MSVSSFSVNTWKQSPQDGATLQLMLWFCLIRFDVTGLNCLRDTSRLADRDLIKIDFYAVETWFKNLHD